MTRAFFAQRDFSQTAILEELYHSLIENLAKRTEETILIGKPSPNKLMIGTNLRDLVHKFRHRTLVLLKMLVLQKKVSSTRPR